jgi:hypothetical protein
MVSFDDPASQNSKTETNYIRMEGRFTSFDSTPIFYQGWKPLTDAKAVVIITHGQGEHSECYHRVVRHFAGKGFEFWAWDLRVVLMAFEAMLPAFPTTFGITSFLLI